MKVNRNPEVKKETIIFVIITVLMAAACFAINVLAGIIALAAGIIFVILHIIFANRRYKKIAELAGKIDQILHSREQVLIEDSEEGELAILNSEVCKMTIRLHEQTEQLLAEKKNLSAAIEDIFHQMRTPLTSMLINMELLSKKDMEYDKRIQLTHEVKKQIERMKWLVESLLKMSKISAGTAAFAGEKVMLKDVIRQASEPFLIQMELRGQTFNAQVGDESFIGDLDWTIEALSNLIKNCMEHTKDGGIIDVIVSENAIYTEITISDNGEGFCNEDIPYLFDRFYKGKNAAPESIGIGLALSKSIIKQQNGVISARNNASGGAEFNIKFYKCLTV